VLRRPDPCGYRAVERYLRRCRCIPGDGVGTTGTPADRTRRANPWLCERGAAAAADLDEATWLARWQDDHTQVAIDTQSTFGYTQNAVVRALTEDSPPISAIVEELFPIQTAHTHKMPFQSIFSGDSRKSRARYVPDRTWCGGAMGGKGVLR